MANRVNVGDVFEITLDDRRKVYGQVVGKYRNDGYYLAVFDRVLDREQSPPLELVLDAPVSLLALSFNAKLANGQWPIVGRADVADDMPLPAYKEAVGSPDNVQVVDYSATHRRPATADEARALPNRTLVAPIRLEKALRALQELEPWRSDYDALLPNEALTTRRLFPA